MEGRASTVVPCGSPESRPKGRGQPRRSVVRTPLLLWGASLPSTPRAGSDGWRARASRRACSPLGDTHNHPIGPPRLHRGSGSRAGWGYSDSGGALLAAHSNSRRRRRRGGAGGGGEAGASYEESQPVCRRRRANRRYTHTENGWRVQSAPGLETACGKRRLGVLLCTSSQHARDQTLALCLSPDTYQ